MAGAEDPRADLPGSFIAGGAAPVQDAVPARIGGGELLVERASLRDERGLAGCEAAVVAPLSALDGG